MNILYIVLLFCVICHVFVTEASSSASQVSEQVSSIEDSYEAGRFRSAINKGDVEIGKRFFEDGDDEQRKYYGEYLISLGKDSLVELIKSSDVHKYWLLRIII